MTSADPQSTSSNNWTSPALPTSTLDRPEMSAAAQLENGSLANGDKACGTKSISQMIIYLVAILGRTIMADQSTVQSLQGMWKPMESTSASNSQLGINSGSAVDSSQPVGRLLECTTHYTHMTILPGFPRAVFPSSSFQSEVFDRFITAALPIQHHWVSSLYVHCLPVDKATLNISNSLPPPPLSVFERTWSWLCAQCICARCCPWSMSMRDTFLCPISSLEWRSVMVV